MRHQHLERELNLLLLLAENKKFTTKEICERIGISLRSLYYYLDFFRQAGFRVEKRGNVFSLDRSSAFFTRLSNTLQLTEDEAVTVVRLLRQTGDDSLQVKHIRQKLERFYDLDIMADVTPNGPDADIVATLYEAIKTKNKAVIHNYSSPHSNTVTSRVVEPFTFLDNNNEVRCYEITTRMNKTFKLSRMESVEMLLDPWEHEAMHSLSHTDIFMFSSERLVPVELRLDRLARNVLVEERPLAARSIVPDGDRHWLARLEVCSYVGVGRFVLGLYDNVEVLADEGFKSYIRQRVEAMASRLPR